MLVNYRLLAMRVRDFSLNPFCLENIEAKSQAPSFKVSEGANGFGQIIFILFTFATITKHSIIDHIRKAKVTIRN